jgi:hypothetical protein
VLRAVLPQVLPTQLVPDEKEGKILRVRLIMKDGKKLFDPVYLFDQGSTVSWIPCGRKLTCSFPGAWRGSPPARLLGAARQPWLNRCAPAAPRWACQLCSCASTPHPPPPPQPHPPQASRCSTAPTRTTARRCLCWRWTASLTSWRS